MLYQLSCTPVYVHLSSSQRIMNVVAWSLLKSKCKGSFLLKLNANKMRMVGTVRPHVFVHCIVYSVFELFVHKYRWGGGEHLWESTFSHPSHKRHWCQETSLLRVSRLMLIMTGALYVQEAQAQPFQWNLSSSFGVSKNSENNIFSTVIYLMEVTIFHLTHNFSCSWELRTQKLKSYLLRTQCLNA